MQNAYRSRPAQIKAGELNQRILLMVPVSKVISGKATTEWTDGGSPWAAVNPLSVTDIFAAAAENFERTTRFTIRYRSGVTEKMQIRFRDNDYKIVSVINPGSANVKLEILAEILNGGAT